MSNTPPANRQPFSVCKPIEDTAHISLWLEYKNLRELVERLDCAKHAAKNTHENRTDSMEEIPDLLPSQLIFGDTVWNAKPHSISKKRLNFPYVLQSAGVTFMFNTNPCGETMPNGWLEFGSIPLTYSGGLQPLWNNWKEEFAETIVINKHILSRVDLCIDVLNVPVVEFTKRYLKDKLITHAKFDDDHYEGNHKFGRKATGITIGSALRMNIYDKMREVLKDDYKITVMMNEKWLLKIHTVPKEVTRIEFQAKRKGVKEYLIGRHRIDTCEDWEAHKPEVLKYLMYDFCRFAQGKIDRKNNNQHRAKTWRMWKRIFNDAVKQLGVDDPKTLADVKRQKRTAPIDFKALNKQGLACLIRSYIYTGHDPKDFSSLVGWLADVAIRLQNSGELPELIKRALVDMNNKILT